MAGSDADRRAAGAVSTEEADRLSEAFKPSWEEDPATVPRDPPAPARPSAPPAAPKQRPAPAPAAPRAPVVSVSAVKPSPPRTGAAAKATPEETPIALKAQKRATLLGISPSPVPSSPGHGPAADDLDWEAPTNPLPAAAPNEPDSAVRPAAGAPPALEAAPSGDDIEVRVDVEELPPESKPSGIGQKYKPKDEGAPPVMLGVDVQAAELGAQARLEAEHRARRAPTIAGMKAIDLPLPQTPETPDVDFVPPKKSSGLFLVLAGIVMLLGAGGVLAYALRGPSSAPEPPPPSPGVATVSADTRAPPPPALSAPEPAPAAIPTPTATEAAAQPSPTAAPSAEEAAPPAEATAKPGKGKPAKPVPSKPATAAKPASQPKVAATPKPAAPAPTLKPGAKAGGKSVIVRDSPF